MMRTSRGKKVLVAEDDPDIQDLIAFCLEYAGFAVTLASDGEEAVAKAETEHPDLILLDVRMPRLTGYEACETVKSQASTRDIPVVFISARGQESEIKYGLGLGAVEYILKPFAPDELCRRLSAILDRVGRPKDG